MSSKTLTTRRLVVYALFIAITIVLTLLIRIPLPMGAGYVNIGDSILLLAGLLISPSAGFWVGGLGSAMADVFAQYTFYAPITFVVKGLEGYLAGWLFGKMKQKNPLAATIAGGIWMAIGYFFGDWTLFTLATAIGTFPFNLIQGIVGSILAVLLYKLIGPVYRKYFHTATDSPTVHSK